MQGCTLRLCVTCRTLPEAHPFLTTTTYLACVLLLLGLYFLSCLVPQITEVGKPDPYDDDASTDGPAGSCDERPGSSHGATSPSPVAGMAGGQGGTLMSTGVPTQQRSPLAGRCNMWNLLWSWSVKVRWRAGAWKTIALCSECACCLVSCRVLEQAHAGLKRFMSVTSRDLCAHRCAHR